jgi:hypothetical protein
MFAGDSKVVLDRSVGKKKLEILSLTPWKAKILDLKRHFTEIKCMHMHM